MMAAITGFATFDLQGLGIFYLAWFALYQVWVIPASFLPRVSLCSLRKTKHAPHSHSPSSLLSSSSSFCLRARCGSTFACTVSSVILSFLSVPFSIFTVEILNTILLASQCKLDSPSFSRITMETNYQLEPEKNISQAVAMPVLKSTQQFFHDSCMRFVHTWRISACIGFGRGCLLRRNVRQYPHQVRQVFCFYRNSLSCAWILT